MWINMDLPSTDSFTIKVEPGTQEDDGDEIPYTEIDIHLPDIKKECLEYSESVGRMAELPKNDKKYMKKLYLQIQKGGVKIERIVGYYTCPCCGFSSQGRKDFNFHFLTHSDDKPLSCSDCSYSCIRKSELKIHMLKHSGEKPYLCSECGYLCNQMLGLKQHNMIAHSGEKPFSCAYCSYATPHKSKLTRHMLTHSDEKRFSCPNCSYSCHRKWDLTSHMRKHSGNKL